MADITVGAIVVPYPLAVAAGVVAGSRSGTVNGYKSTSSTAGQAVRATTYVAGSSNVQRSVASSSALDTSAGTGARTVKITYYDAAMAGPFEETVTLNGTSNVNTVSTTICFIEKMEVITVGSTGGNAGTISLFAAVAGGGGALVQIAASDNSTFFAHHYVAAGKTCFVLGLRAGATVTNGSAVLTSTGDPNATNLATANVTGNLRHGSGNQVQSVMEWDPPLAIVGPNLIIITCRPDANTASVTYASFDYIEF